jgi:hypothetical protein
MNIEIKQFSLRYKYIEKSIKTPLKYVKIQGDEYFGFVREEDLEIAKSFNHLLYWYIGFNRCSKIVYSLDNSKLSIRQNQINPRIRDLYHSNISFEDFVYLSTLEML